jgi:predicted MFS family arabinose efflux permease
MPLPLVALGVMIKPLSALYGWPRAAMSASILLTATGTMLLSPVMGHVVDRIGPRRMGLVGLLGLGAAIAGIGLCGPSIWSWYLAWAVYAIVQPAAGNIVWATAVTGWFDRDRGVALAVMLTGGSLLYSFLPAASVFLIQHVGWRSVFFALGGFVILIAWPLAWRFFFGADDSRRLGRGGFKPDSSPAPAYEGLTLRAALRTRQFWQLAAAGVIAATGVATLFVHLQPILTDAGLAPMRAAAAAVVIGPAALLGRFGAGLLVDRVPARFVAAVVLLFPAVSYGLLIGYDGSLGRAVAAAAALGVSEGAETSLVAYLAGRYFGRRAFGSIYGLLLGAYSMGYGIAPVVAGRVFDVLRSYQPIFWPLAIAAIAGAALLATLGKPLVFAATIAARTEARGTPGLTATAV